MQLINASIRKIHESLTKIYQLTKKVNTNLNRESLVSAEKLLDSTIISATRYILLSNYQTSKLNFLGYYLLTLFISDTLHHPAVSSGKVAFKNNDPFSGWIYLNTSQRAVLRILCYEFDWQ